MAVEESSDAQGAARLCRCGVAARAPLVNNWVAGRRPKPGPGVSDLVYCVPRESLRTTRQNWLRFESEGFLYLGKMGLNQEKMIRLI